MSLPIQCPGCNVPMALRIVDDEGIKESTTLTYCVQCQADFLRELRAGVCNFDPVEVEFRRAS